MANKYYIACNRAFTNKAEAIQYCNENDFDPVLMVETQPIKLRYYELQVTPDNCIFHNTFLTSEQLEEKQWKETIENYKAGEYYSRFVHLKEITEKQYRQYTAM